MTTMKCKSKWVERSKSRPVFHLEGVEMRMGEWSVSEAKDEEKPGRPAKENQRAKAHNERVLIINALVKGGSGKYCHGIVKTGMF